MKNNWLKEHIMEILAIGGVLQFLAVSMLILFRTVKTTDSTTIMILTSSITIATIILNYYFGSSKSSKDKDKQIADLNENKNP